MKTLKIFIIKHLTIPLKNRYNEKSIKLYYQLLEMAPNLVSLFLLLMMRIKEILEYYNEKEVVYYY